MVKFSIVFLALVLAFSFFANAAKIEILSPSISGNGYVVSGNKPSLKVRYDTIIQTFSAHISCPLVSDNWFTITQEYYDPDISSFMADINNFNPPYEDEYEYSKIDTTGMYGECTLYVQALGLAKHGNKLLWDALIDSGKINFKASPGLGNFNEAALVYRPLQASAFAGKTVNVPIMIYTNEEKPFKGLVIRENIPEGLELASDEDGWISNVDYTYDKEERQLKIVLMDIDAVEEQNLYYKVKIPLDSEPGTKFSFSGTWMVLGEENDVKSWHDSLEVSGVAMPQCPITDEELLEYIQMWANEELGETKGGFVKDDNDLVMMEILEAWSNC